jgi:NAD(P)-dependent dehydrogenase (short-subunit alcohol dehydrogenase family)
MASLSGRHALVTGGGSGIGAAVASSLAAAGAAVSIVGRRSELLERMASEVAGIVPIVADVTNAAACEAMAVTASAAHGPIDIVVANAGAAESCPAARMDLAHWNRMIGVNLTGAFLTVKAALPQMIDRARSDSRDRRIVFVASTAALKGYPYVAAYCAAKHGVVGLARALAAELASTAITVNAVCPGYTETALLEGSVQNIVAKTGRTRDEAARELARLNPQGRFIDPQEVAATVLWLCSPDARSVTGQAISVSGGEV